jgi:hypothetical protein
METQESFFEPLLEKSEQYWKTSFELYKLKTVDKTADVLSTMISRLLLIIIFSLFALTINIAVALWLGDLMGKSYYGFLIVASFYAFIGIILFFLRPLIKTQINNSIIVQILN